MFGIENEGVCLLQRHSKTDPLFTAYLAGIGRDVLVSLYVALLPPLLPSAAAPARRRIYLQSHNMIWYRSAFTTASRAPHRGRASSSARSHHPRHAPIYFVFDGAPNDSPIAPSTDPLELQLVGTFVEYEVSIPLMDDDVQISPVLGGVTHSPLWLYQFGLLQTGFMPIDPRDSVGVVKDPFDGVFSAWQTGGAPATPLPTHIPTARIASLTFVTPVAGCTYPDAWSTISPPVPEVFTETPSR
ncbi:hypothetical protein B0H14DRAFT_3498303 [Mycena olivaceomarginata]|nr:hypothetical protein B0H14DRAFT_3498303 [Mycena olivaceomarginata]